MLLLMQHLGFYFPLRKNTEVTNRVHFIKEQEIQTSHGRRTARKGTWWGVGSLIEARIRPVMQQPISKQPCDGK
jgi:hypothetical protein